MACCISLALGVDGFSEETRSEQPWELTADDDAGGCSVSLLQVSISNEVNLKPLDQEMPRDSTAKESLSTSQAEYYWPSGRGSVGSYGVSSFPATRQVASQPTWSWHDPKGRWSNIPIGTAIDDEKNIYLTLADGMNKFTQNGTLLWSYKRTFPDEVINTASSLLDGRAYCITSKGRAFSVDMMTGTEVWSNTVGAYNDGNYAQVAADDGVVIAATAETEGMPNSKVVGLNAEDGTLLWEYTPDINVWNFAASFVGDGTFVFQSQDGMVYRNRVADGSNMWKAGGVMGSWTDGAATVGPNGIAYGVANYNDPSAQDGVGVLSAYDLSDGTLIWSQPTASPPNDVPVVGRLANNSHYSVVLPGGQQCEEGQQIHVWAFDASTGSPQWAFDGPSQIGQYVAGDFEGVAARLANGIQPMTMPNPWGQASIDSDGIVYVGGETGHFFSLVDTDGDGKVTLGDSAEVSSFDTGAAFVGSSGPAIAPGMLAVGDQSTLHVWLHTV